MHLSISSFEESLSSELKSCILEDTMELMSHGMEISESNDNLRMIEANATTPTSSGPPERSGQQQINSPTVSASLLSSNIKPKPADKPLLRRKSELPTYSMYVHVWFSTPILVFRVCKM